MRVMQSYAHFSCTTESILSVSELTKTQVEVHTQEAHVEVHTQEATGMRNSSACAAGCSCIRVWCLASAGETYMSV